MLQSLTYIQRRMNSGDRTMRPKGSKSTARGRKRYPSGSFESEGSTDGSSYSSRENKRKRRYQNRSRDDFKKAMLPTFFLDLPFNALRSSASGYLSNPAAWLHSDDFSLPEPSPIFHCFLCSFASLPSSFSWWLQYFPDSLGISFHRALYNHFQIRRFLP